VPDTKTRTPARDAFERLVLLETDDCVIWPHTKTVNGHGVLRADGQRRWVSRLVLERRVGPRPAGALALHGPCHQPACMNYRHLRWGTKAENAADRLRDGTHQLGSRNHHARLTEQAVLEIRRRYAAGGVLHRELAAEFGVRINTITQILNRQRWAHVP